MARVDLYEMTSSEEVSQATVDQADPLESAHDVHQNEAERILHSLQSSRRAAPLEQARVPHDTSVAVPIPLELIGASSRALRKAISVPLATSQSGESARQRRERERLGDNHNIMISPYGRTKVAHREEQKRRQERSASVMDEGEYIQQLAGTPRQ